MNEVIDSLMTRRSIREYTGEQVSRKDLEQIVECGMYAPTAMGKQSPRIVAVQDADTVSKLSKMNAAIWGRDIDPFYGAPTVIIVFAEAGNPNSVQDASLIMGNLLNAAHALGLGSCWINRAKEMFAKEDGLALMRQWGLGDNYVGVGICALGHIGCEYPKPVPRKDDYAIYA